MLIQNIKICNSISLYTYVYKEYLIIFYINDLQLPDFNLIIAEI